ncbi:hypothetical protein, partial [Acidithiobacillus sp.]|uniref:hypothetical protein n=1 Tax=Acidithiobacillus sp. TaxID=1872118 RepID=UPI003D06BFE9
TVSIAITSPHKIAFDEVIIVLCMRLSKGIVMSENKRFMDLSVAINVSTPFSIASRYRLNGLQGRSYADKPCCAWACMGKL